MIDGSYIERERDERLGANVINKFKSSAVCYNEIKHSDWLLQVP